MGSGWRVQGYGAVRNIYKAPHDFSLPLEGKVPEGRIGRSRYANHYLKSVAAFTQVCWKRLHPAP